MKQGIVDSARFVFRFKKEFKETNFQPYESREGHVLDIRNFCFALSLPDTDPDYREDIFVTTSFVKKRGEEKYRWVVTEVHRPSLLAHAVAGDRDVVRSIETELLINDGMTFNQSLFGGHTEASA